MAAYPKATSPHSMTKAVWGSASHRSPSGRGRTPAQPSPVACCSSPGQGLEWRHGHPSPLSRGARAMRCGTGDALPLVVSCPVPSEAWWEGTWLRPADSIRQHTSLCHRQGGRRWLGAQPCRERSLHKWAPQRDPGAGCQPSGAGTLWEWSSLHSLCLVCCLRPAGPSHQPPASEDPWAAGVTQVPGDGQLWATWLKGPEAPQNMN